MGPATTTSDAGQELLGNRRRQRPLTAIPTATDFAQLRQTQRRLLTRRQAIWPRPDYVRLVKGGVNKTRARVVKALYDIIPPTTETAFTQHSYLLAVSAMREMASQWMREQESSAAFADYCNAPIEKTAWNSNLKIEWVLRRELVTRILQHAHHLSGQVHDEGWLCQALTYSKKGFGLLNLHIERSTVLAIAQSDWPAPRPHWQVSGCHVVAKDTLSIEKPRTEPASLNLSVWLRVPIPGSSTAVLLDRSNREQAQAEIDALKSFCVFTDRRGDTCRIVNSYDSRQEAVEAAIRLAAHAPRRQIWQPDKVESSCCVRIGPDQRGGADVSAAQVMKSLGLRGLNFGNWISSTRERQWHLNQVQDAVHDLALLIGVPPAWLGQWGTLGLAVGAQGKGLSRAAGHFVAGIDEINLTRRRGIGVLAHELGHFVDHIAARMLGGEESFLSERVNLGFAKVVRLDAQWWVVPHAFKAVQSVDDAMAKVMGALLHTVESDDAFRKRTQDSLAYSRAILAQLLEEIQSHCPQQFEQARELVHRIGRAGIETKQLGYTSAGTHPDTLGLQALCSHLPSESAWLSRSLHAVDTIYRNTHDPDQLTSRHLCHSQFYVAACQLDSIRGGTKPYWSTHHELFARAFSDWVVDRLAKKGLRNDYLSSDFASLYEVARAQGSIPCNPHLLGTERAHACQAIDELVAQLAVFGPMARPRVTAEPGALLETVEATS